MRGIGLDRRVGNFPVDGRGSIAGELCEATTMRCDGLGSDRDRCLSFLSELQAGFSSGYHFRFAQRKR